MNEAREQEKDLRSIRALIKDDMRQVNELIQEKLHSEIRLIDQLGHYIINSGGKRLRPALVLLSANCFGRHDRRHIELAAIIEFIHTATLLHDDVVDSSMLRRGQATANQRWGNEASVLVGDFLYSRAFQMMVEIDSMSIMTILADATNKIAEGEVQQLINRYDPETTEERYLQVIHHKTAKLFEAAAQAGAAVAGQDPRREQAMAAYGKHLGIAYQFIDDLLDYSAPSERLGKNIGDDLAEGKPTLPLLYAMWNSPEKEASMIRNAIKTGGLREIEQISQVIAATGALRYTAERAREEAAAAVRALEGLPHSSYLDALTALADFVTARNY